MIKNLLENNGHLITLTGILVVFLGMILIALVIQAFNRFFAGRGERTDHEESQIQPKPKKTMIPHKTVPEDHLVAITVAVELYRRLHFDALDSKVTFERGGEQSAWKQGMRFGQRQLPLR